MAKPYLSDKQQQVYDLILLAGWTGMTCDAVEEKTGLTHQCCSARINELENFKPEPLIEDRGIRRKTRSGRTAVVYVQAGLKSASERTHT
jgi:hypothetical protein